MMTSIWLCFRVPGLELRGKNLRSDPSWLFLAMVVFLRRSLLKALPESLLRFDLQSSR